MTTYENEIEKQRILRHETKNEFLAIKAKLYDKQKNKEIIDYIDTNGTGQIKQIGIQSAPGFQMCIDGEQIRIGRSGLYEIKNGVIIKFIGFVIDPEDNQHFMLDYLY